ncbi:MAG: DUF3106 domain-containing protein [Verrucomicrobiota bacterium]
MSRLSHILLLTALSAGPGMLLGQTEPVAGQDGKNLPKEERPAGPASSENGREGSRGRRDSRGPRSPTDAFRSSMDDFRWLLAMTPEERELDLANKSESFRTMMLTKLKEYDALTPEQQELRIRSTELFFDMMYLLGASPEKRAEKLERMSEDRRTLVQARLEQWDKLPAELQQEVREHQSTLRYVIRVDAAPADAKEDVFAGMSAEYRERVKARIAEVNALPKEQRTRMIDNFHSLFDLSDKEQQSILQKLNQAERAKVEQKLAEFEKLSPEERKKCMDSARRFNNLSADEQARFMATAERWEKMSEEERNTWRNLVKQMPPLPLGFQPMPPLPPGAKPGLNSRPNLPSAPNPAP